MNNLKLPVIPENITVHLGPASSDAPNVTVPFVDYIKNVASSEIYPTWPDEALRANILAQISFALNRVFTEYYRARGYDFDITNDTATDQSFVPDREIFQNISRIVDEIYYVYLSRRGYVEPLFAIYCDGIQVQCDGLSQWGTVTLAEDGLSAEQIVKFYYGDNVDLVYDAEISGVTESYPGQVLHLGDSGTNVLFVQNRLNRISQNYPAIPKIVNPLGFYGQETEEAVRKFQEIFDLPQTGTVGRETWYATLRVYSAVKRLSELSSEGLTVEDVERLFESVLSEGSVGRSVRELQYLIDFIAEFVVTVPTVQVDGIFGPRTRESVERIQEVYGQPVTGVVNRDTWDLLFRIYSGILGILPDSDRPIRPSFPGSAIGIGQSGESVRLIQRYLDFIALFYTQIPELEVDGIFGRRTQAAVEQFQREMGLEPTGVVDEATWDMLVDTYYRLKEATE